MIYLVIGIIGLLILVALFTFLSRSGKEKQAPVVAPPADCCGAHEICEKGLKKATTTIEYFDDEELDAYADTPSDLYNDAQIDHFREILYTLLPQEIPDWLISLEKRRILFPDLLKQELLDLQMG